MAFKSFIPKGWVRSRILRTLAERSQLAAPFPSSFSSKRKPGRSVTAGAMRDWKGKVCYERQLCISHCLIVHVFLYEGPVGQHGLEGKQICEFILGLPHLPLQRAARGYVTQLSTVAAEEELLVRARQGNWRKTKHMLPWADSFHPPGNHRSPIAFGSRTVGAGNTAAQHCAFPKHLLHPSPVLAQFLPTGSYSGSTRCSFDTHGSFLLLQPLLPV